MSIFEQATRKKLQFYTRLGNLTVEDLWDLPLTIGRGCNLNEIAINLHRTIEANMVSFVEPASGLDPDDKLRFDIVKHIIDVKKRERDEAKESAAKAQRKQKLLDVLARKQDAALENMSEDEIRALIDQT